MNFSDRHPYEGPRTPALVEQEAVVELSRLVFFGDSPDYQDAIVPWPMYLRPETRENTFSMFYQGQPVSTIVRLCRDAYIHGHRFRIGFIGSVCTHPDHRGKGLAGAILDASMQRFADGDVDFVYISGARSLYYRSGANHIGGFPVFFLKLDNIGSIEREKTNIRQANLDDADLLNSFNEGEETRLVRDALDYELVLQHGHCSGGQCIFNIIESDSVPVAYIALRGMDRKEDSWSQRVIEFAGDRAAILSAMATIVDEAGANGRLVIETRAGDSLANQLNKIGVESTAGRIGGTVKLPHFTRTMAKLRPYFGEKLGFNFAKDLEFAAGEERYVISGEGGALEIDGESNMLWALLGSPPGSESENIRVTGLMEKALEICLPIPLPSLIMNTI